MDISEEDIDKLIAIVTEEAMQACRLQARLVGEKLDDSERKAGYLLACEHLGIGTTVREHVKRHKPRIMAAIIPPEPSTRRAFDISRNLHETTLSSRIKNVLYKAGFERIHELKNLSRHRFLKFYKTGEATLRELETYLGRPLSDAVFPTIDGESVEDQRERYRDWLSRN